MRKQWNSCSTRTKFPNLELLATFWKSHDPTQMNRQGPDFGTQYRSAIFFHDAEQEKEARASKAVLEKEAIFKRPIVTQIQQAPAFYPAEDYHQQYFEKQGIRPATTRACSHYRRPR